MISSAKLQCDCAFRGHAGLIAENRWAGIGQRNRAVAQLQSKTPFDICLMAEGTLVPDENRKTGALQSAQMSEAEIDMNLADSFPASDPPSWTLGMDHHRKPDEPDKPVSQQRRDEPCN